MFGKPWISGVVLVWLCACTSSGGSSTDGNTTWLKLCDTSTECGTGFACTCGLCTRSCATEAACADLGPGAACIAPENFGSACATAPVPTGPVCLALCVTDADCHDGRRCSNGVCGLPPTTRVDAGADSNLGSGGRTDPGGASGDGGAGDHGRLDAGEDAAHGGAGGTTSGASGGGGGAAGSATGGASSGGAPADRDAGNSGDASATGGASSTPDAGRHFEITAITAGGYHSCAVVNGGIQCWGSGSHGTLGAGGGVGSSKVPVKAVGITGGATAVAAAYAHTCAVVNGGAWCWGDNTYGQLGDPSLPRDPTFSTPIPVANLSSGVSAIAVGDKHSCALVYGGVMCWGDNGAGQLGVPTVPSSAAPVWVTGLGPGSGVTALIANGFDTCAIVNGGQWCWGDDTYGQLGNGSSGTMKNPVPVQPTGFGSGVQGIAIGEDDFICTLQGGAMYCSGTTDTSLILQKTSVPVLDETFPASGGQAIAGGYKFGVGIVNGLLTTWGISGRGRTDVQDFPAQAVAAGGYHSCALSNGDVWCWGWNIGGEVGSAALDGGTSQEPKKVGPWAE